MKEYKYKLISITDLEGNPKADLLREIEELHSLYGTIPFKEGLKEGVHLCFYYDNGSRRMLRTSPLKEVEIKDEEGIIRATTLNSIYLFELCKEKKKTLNVTLRRTTEFKGTIEVPNDMDIEEAKSFALELFDVGELNNLEYISDSYEIDGYFALLKGE